MVRWQKFKMEKGYQAQSHLIGGIFKNRDCQVLLVSAAGSAAGVMAGVLKGCLPAHEATLLNK